MIYGLYLLIGIAIGFGFGFFIFRSKSGTQSVDDALIAKQELDEVKTLREALAIEKASLQGRLDKSIEVFEAQRQQLTEREESLRIERARAERLDAEKNALNQKLADQLKELEKLNDRFKLEFQHLASEILKQNTRDFSESNQKQIGEILSPLKERIEKFENRVNEVYNSETQSRSQLMGQVQSLMELNKQISEEAHNLTNALKGDSKTQGAWGEFILEKILESSGLENGVEYETQISNRTEDGIFRPDVIIKLPENKVIVVDSKVSLTAYEAYVNSDSIEERSKFLQQHLLSMRTHVKGLSGKNYQLKTSGHSLDFVLMFVPIEAGFTEALRNDRELYNFAWENRIVIVSPTTLLVTLRTIASVWKQEKQNKNVQEIARMAGAMYDKFVGFMEDMGKIDRSLANAKSAYDDALGKLSVGRGNLVNTAQKVKILGAKTSKDLPIGLTEFEED